MATEQEIQTDGATKDTNPKKKISDYFHWWSNTTDRFAFLLVVVTFLLFIATVGLYSATRDLVHDADRNARRQLRAYVFVDAATVNLKGQTLEGVVTLKNSGQTPAYDLGTEISVHTRSDDKKPFPPKDTKLEPRGILAPNNVTMCDIRLIIPLPAENGNIDVIQLAKDGPVSIYIVGWLRYRDAFGEWHNLDFKLRSHQFVGGNSWTLGFTPDGNKETQEET